jgi:hypothetical protein
LAEPFTDAFICDFTMASSGFLVEVLEVGGFKLFFSTDPTTFFFNDDYRADLRLPMPSALLVDDAFLVSVSLPPMLPVLGFFFSLAALSVEGFLLGTSLGCMEWSSSGVLRLVEIAGEVFSAAAFGHSRCWAVSSEIISSLWYFTLLRDDSTALLLETII